MAPSTADAPAKGRERELSPRRKLLVAAVLTPILLLPLTSRSVTLGPTVLALVIGAIVGMGFEALLDRYRQPLQQWNDALVIVVVVVPLSLASFAMSRVLGTEIVGYQAIGTVSAVWAATLQSLARQLLR